MCGIVGILGANSEQTVRSMVDKINHRGPDNTSVFSDDIIHLGHARLSIIDVNESSNQPLWDSKSRACIVFNGEIYNYRELRDKLKEKGFEFNSNGDAEVLLNLYLDQGEGCLDEISGIFSFAIWDKDKQQLFIARDNFGVKPLYYSSNEKGFFFASEMKSLLCVPSIKRDVNYDSLYRSLVFLWSPGEFTLLKNVHKLKPAHYIIVKDSKIVKYEKYWDWPQYDPEFFIDCKQHQDRVFDALNSAVKEQLISDVEVGAFLSGGLDSSLIVAMAKLQTESKINCFTINCDSSELIKEGVTDDLPYAKKVASYLDTELDILKVTPDIKRLLPKMIYHLDELQADPASINVMLICEQAQKKGIKVLLSGAGGDDIFTGYRRHFAVKQEKIWSWLPSGFRFILKSLTGNLPKKVPLMRRVAKAFQYANLPDDERLLSYFFWLDPKVAKGLFKQPDMISESAFEFMYDDISSIKTTDPVERMLVLEQKYFLVDHNFNYTDKMSMAAGIEVRVPFLDKNVLNVASKIPSKLKQSGNIGKAILKKAAEALLPKSIIYRPKSGFGAPLRSWLKNDLSESVDDLLSVDSINKRGIFNAEKVQQLINDDRCGKEDYSYPIFALLCFEIWCQQFLDED